VSNSSVLDKIRHQSLSDKTLRKGAYPTTLFAAV
jgi:hypothetical protein